MALVLWFIAVLAFQDRQLFVSPRLWRLLGYLFQGHSELTLLVILFQC